MDYLRDKESNPQLKGNLYFSLTVVLLAILAGYSGFHVADYFEKPTGPEKELRLNNRDYSFINPLIGYTENDSGPLLADDIDNLKNKINNITNNQKSVGNIKNGSVYYRDLNNGPWFMAGDMDAGYKPSSLFKVPIMIAYFKVAENDPYILEKVLTYEKEFEKVVTFMVDSSDKTIELGKSYTVLELIENMIVYSDNLSAYLLIQNIDSDVVVQVFKDLGVPSPTDITYKEAITPRTYASFLRILYNATYLNRDYSEKALEILSRTSFKYGIKSVLNNDVQSSVKYGIGVNVDGSKQLHECGIVYWRIDRPILLCIMTMGYEYNVMSNYLKEVTRVVQDATLVQ